MPEYPEFVTPIFAAGLANYGAQDSPFVTPFVGMAIGGLGLAHVPTNVALLVPSALHASSKSTATDANAVKGLVRKQVYVEYFHSFYCGLFIFLYFFSEYYFSEDNLQRDFFLRRKMDADGYLPISLIASFHRVQALTQDVNLVVQALQQSALLQLKDGVKVSSRIMKSTQSAT